MHLSYLLICPLNIPKYPFFIAVISILAPWTSSDIGTYLSGSYNLYISGILRGAVCHSEWVAAPQYPQH